MISISLKHTVVRVAVLNIVLFSIYANTIKQLFEFWSNSFGYSHGIILFPLAMGIYFYELYKVPRFNTQCLNFLTVLSLLGLTLIWFLADIINIQFVEFTSFFLILIIFNFILTAQNFKNVNHLWPLLLIALTLPIWDFIPEILRTIETPIVVLALNASFIEAVQDGFLIYIPAGTFLVEAGCSGFNQFIVSIPLSILFLYSRNIKLAAGYKYIFILLFLAMIFNTLRIYIILVIGQISHMKSPLLEDHEFLAWIIYGIGVFFYFYYIDKKLDNLDKLPERVSVTSTSLSFVSTKKQSLPIILLTLMVLIGPLLAVGYSSFKDKTPLNIQGLRNNLHWKEISQPSRFVPNFDKGDLVYDRNLANLFGQTVNLYINYFMEQEQGREAINGISSLISDKKGSVIRQSQYTVKLSSTDQLMVNESIIELRSGAIFIAWQWYFTNGQHISKSMDARLNNLAAILKNTPQMSNIVISKRITVNETQTRKTLEQFLLDNLSVLTRYLGNK